MSVNVNNPILENKIEIDFNLKERIKNSLICISNYLKSLFNQKMKNYSPDLIVIIKKELLNFALVLKPLKTFRAEYIEFLKIKTMMYYVLENIDSIDFNHIKSIFELMYKFNDLIRSKFISIEENSLELYDAELKSYIFYLKDFESFFYSNIYERTGEFDDVIMEMSKVLLEDELV